MTHKFNLSKSIPAAPVRLCPTATTTTIMEAPHFVLSSQGERLMASCIIPPLPLTQSLCVQTTSFDFLHSNNKFEASFIYCELLLTSGDPPIHLMIITIIPPVDYPFWLP